jgi:hypothetical protein
MRSQISPPATTTTPTMRPSITLPIFPTLLEPNTNNFIEPAEKEMEKAAEIVYKVERNILEETPHTATQRRRHLN